MKDRLKKNWGTIVFAAVILLAIFLRVWHFHDWLFFKMDQARDANLIKQALEKGPGYLPLLGPKAGGTELNLGPAFYYFQYIFAFLFQSAHPAVLAYSDLLFGILTIPLFFLYLKKYFSRNWSMVLAGLFSVNFLAIEYSRFAWNPNSLPFFNLLYFYALLNVFDPEIRYRLRWIVLAGLAFSISTQLHFLSLATLPVITAIFFWFNRKDISRYLSWKKVAVFAGIIILVYLPVAFNEVVSHGENTAEFISALKEKPSHHSLPQNIIRDVRYWGQNWFLILTSSISSKTGVRGASLAWLGVILPALFLGARRYFKKEKERPRKNFILLSFLWFAIYFLAYIPIAYQIRPRFFLPLAVLPFIFIGYLVNYFWEKKGKLLKTGVVAAILVIFFGNLAGTYFWFKEIKAAERKGIYPRRTIILKEQDGIVLWHFEKATEYLKKNCGESVVYYSSNAEYRHPIKFVLAYEGVRALSIKDYEKGGNGCFYAFGLSRSKERSLDPDLAGKFEIAGSEKIGALSLFKLDPTEYFLENPPKPKKEKEEKRIFWKDIKFRYLP